MIETFLGVFNNPDGITAKELLHYLEYVVAHGDGDSIVCVSSVPVVNIKYGLVSVDMEIDNSFGVNMYTGEPFVVNPKTCGHDWEYVKTVDDVVLMKQKHYYQCNICGIVRYEYEVD